MSNDFLGYISYQTELDRLVDDLAEKALSDDEEAYLDDTFLVMGPAEVKYIKNRLYEKYSIIADI